MTTKTHFDIIEHEADLCVVGGGIAGLCAAVAAVCGGPYGRAPGSPQVE